MKLWVVILFQAFTTISFANPQPDICAHTQIIAHRGLSGRAPEESLISYLLASDLNADFIEMDVQRSADGALILNHDDSFARTTDIKTVFPKREKAEVSSFNFSEIEKLNTGLVFNQTHKSLAHPRFNDAKIITLENAIDLALTHPNHPGLYIESKNAQKYPGIETEIVDLLQRKNAFAHLKITFQSFDRGSIVRFTKLVPGIPAVFLTDSYFYKKLVHSDLKFAKQNSLGLGPKIKTVGTKRLASFLKLAHAANVFVHFYTVDEPNEMTELIRNQADGFFTNRADLAEIACQRILAPQVETTFNTRLDL